MSEKPLSILDIINPLIAERNAKRDDAVGQMVKCVLRAASPDGVMHDLAHELLSGYLSQTRKVKITMLAEAFGAKRDDLKKYLRARSLCGPVD